MAVLSPSTIYAPGRKPPKAEVIQFLEMLQGTGSNPAVVKQTKAALDLVTPASENYGGLVLNDPDPTKNGYYYRSSSTWVKGRGLSDSIAGVTLAGTANAQTGTASGVNPADVVTFFAVVSTENTGPMTLSIAGETPRDVVNSAGNALSAGEWTGAVQFFLNGDGDYQLLINPGAEAAAAQSAADAAASEAAADDAATRAETAAAGVEYPVSYGVVQALDSTQRAQARANIAAVGFSDVHSYWLPSNLELSELSPSALLIGMGDGNGVFDGFNNLAYVDVAGATDADFSTEGEIVPSNATANTWTTTFDTDTTGWTNFNVRLRVAASVVTTSGVAVRLTMKGVSSGTTLAISGMYIGHKATSGDVYDFDGSQVPVTVGGSSSFNVAAGATVVSDWITFPLDETKDVIVAFHTSSGDIRAKTGTSSSTLDLWSKAGSSEISTSNVTGYSQSVGADIGLVDKIEVTTAYDDMAVQSQDINLAEAPDWGRLVAIVQENTAGVNSDVVFKLSRDGLDFATLVMAEKFTRGDGSIYVDSGPVDLTALDFGDTARWSVETANGKGPAILAVGAVFGVNS